MTERADIREIMGRGLVIPVVTISDAGRAVDLAHALLAGGISVIEVTLRTPDALAAASNIVEALPQMRSGSELSWTASRCQRPPTAGPRSPPLRV